MVTFLPQGRGERRSISIATTCFGLVLLALMLFPVYWVLVTSLETQQQIFRTPPYLLPPTPTLESYGRAFTRLAPYIQNSAIIAVGATLLSLLLGAPAAYGLAHLRLRLMVPIILLLLVLQMFPTVMLATPLFLMFNRLGLTNSYAGIILANATVGVPFVIVVLRAYLLTVPFELTEAALVDGASLWGAFWRVIIPVARAGLCTAAIFVFIGAWGDFTFSLTLTSREEFRPATLGLYTFVGQYFTNWNDLMAAAIITALPTALIVVVAQRFITAGLTAGAVKG